MKKLLSIVLSLCMVLTMMTILSFTANAKETDLAASAGVSNGFEYEIHFSGLACITGYSGSATDLTIPTSLDGHPVDEIKPHAFEDCTSLKSVTFPEDRGYRVGEAAFFGCTSLKTVTVKGSIYNIGEYAFGYYDVNSYKKVSGFTIRGYTNSNTQLYAIQNGFSFVSIGSLPAFNYYEYDGNIEITSYNGCDSSVSIPSQIDGYPVTSIGSDSFYHSLLLESVTIPDSVTEIHNYAFAECPSLKNVTIPDSVTTIDYYAFGGCPSLKTVTIPASVESIGDYAFGYTYEYDMETDEDNYYKTPGFTIKGYPDSAAQEYADENGFTFVSPEDTPPEIDLGDIDGDGTVSVLDATRIQKYRAMLCNLDGTDYDGAQPTASQLLVADVDEDGVVSVLDATRIQKYRARLCNLDGSTPYTG
ncbi:MAG: leucine-rich repeat protein [Ruminococcus sp.]|nr:leucine-rich repeat protein [Ruminococcus sp.]